MPERAVGGRLAVAAGAPVAGGEVPGPGPATATGQPPQRRYFPLFDSLRAIAALSVMAIHTAFYSGAVALSRYRQLLAHLNVGVTIFFVLSGFLLYRPFVAARLEGRPRPGIGTYAVRRVARVFPAYWVALLGLGLFPGLYGVFTGNWWVYAGLLQPYAPLYRAGAECSAQAQGCGIVQTWSLSIEVAFYALLPLLALGTHRLLAHRARRAQLRAEAAVLVGLALASVACQVWTLHTAPRLGWLNTTVAATFAWFAMGMGLAVASVALAGRERDRSVARAVVDHPSACWAAAGALYAGLSLWLPATAAANGLPIPLQVAEHVGFGVVAVLLVLPAVFGDGAGGLPRRVLAWPPLAWLGRISYGIFLWHLLIAKELTDRGVPAHLPGSRFLTLTAMTLAVTVVVSAASWYLVERPLLDLAHRRTSGSRSPPT